MMAKHVGVKPACSALEVSRSTWKRQQQIRPPDDGSARRNEERSERFGTNHAATHDVREPVRNAGRRHPEQEAREDQVWSISQVECRESWLGEPVELPEAWRPAPGPDLAPDRGAPMTSQCTAQLLADLGVTRSLSRPQVSVTTRFPRLSSKP